MSNNVNREYNCGVIIMYSEIEVAVTDILFEDDNIQLLATSAGAGQAIIYRTFFPSVEIGDILIVNNTATEKNLGTGGWDIVVAIKGATPYKNESQQGHVIKGRYMPHQHSVDAVEAQESPFHAYFQQSFTLGKTPIFLAELHSMIPILYVLLAKMRQDLSISIIISDEAAMPLSFSKHMSVLMKQENVHAITIGQAFGGHYEAINLWTALQFANEVLKDDILILSLGPGVVGTGTRYGFSGMEQANWANIIGQLKGVPIWVPRISFAEQRERHVGLSHHTITPLVDFTYTSSVLPLPLLKEEWLTLLKRQVELLKNQQHINVSWEDMNTIDTVLKQGLSTYPFPITTMGRGFKDDPAFFYGVAAAVQWGLNQLD